MKILFISTTSRVDRPFNDPSVRYRCYNFAEDYLKFGIVADVISFNYFELDFINFYDIFIFHRPKDDKKLYDALEIIDKQKKICIADYDDLIFDPNYALESSIFKNGRISREKVLEVFESNYRAMLRFRYFTVSTKPLKDLIISLNSNAEISIIRNGLSDFWIYNSKLYREQEIKNKQISYLSGTLSHNIDFKSISHVLQKILYHYSDIKLLLAGELEFDNCFNKDQIRVVKSVKFEHYAKIVSRNWLNICPLEDSVFNRCKSGLKFFESGVFGIPTVASKIEDFERFEDKILYATTPKEWEEKIERLYKDNSYYKKLSLDVYNFCINNCKSIDESKNHLKFIKEIL